MFTKSLSYTFCIGALLLAPGAPSQARCRGSRRAERLRLPIHPGYGAAPTHPAGVI